MFCDRQKISIIGCGKVGMTAAYAITIQGLASELVLVGRDQDKVIGEELDLEHGSLFFQPIRVNATSDYAQIGGSDMIIITAGAAQSLCERTGRAGALWDTERLYP